MLKFSQFFQGTNGAYSSQRFIFVIAMLCILGNWIGVSYKEGKMAEIPESVIVFAALIYTGKVTQRVAEGQGTKKSVKSKEKKEEI